MNNISSFNGSPTWALENNGKILVIERALFNLSTQKHHDIKVELEENSEGDFNKITSEWIHRIQKTYEILLKTLNVTADQVEFCGDRTETYYHIIKEESAKKSLPSGGKTDDVCLSKEDKVRLGERGSKEMTLHDAISRKILGQKEVLKGIETFRGLEADLPLNKSLDRASDKALENYVPEVVLLEFEPLLIRENVLSSSHLSAIREASLNRYSKTLRKFNEKRLNLLKEIEGMPEVDSTLQALDNFLKNPRVKSKSHNERKYERVLHQKLEADPELKRSFDCATEEAQENYVHEIITSYEIENVKRQLTEFDQFCSGVYGEMPPCSRSSKSENVRRQLAELEPLFGSKNRLNVLPESYILYEEDGSVVSDLEEIAYCLTPPNSPTSKYTDEESESAGDSLPILENVLSLSHLSAIREASLNRYSKTLRKFNEKRLNLLKEIEGMPEVDNTLRALDNFLKNPRVKSKSHNEKKYERVLHQKLEADPELKRSFDCATEEAQENYVYEIITSYEIENVKRQLTEFDQFCSGVYGEMPPCSRSSKSENVRRQLAELEPLFGSKNRLNVLPESYILYEEDGSVVSDLEEIAYCLTPPNSPTSKYMDEESESAGDSLPILENVLSLSHLNAIRDASLNRYSKTLRESNDRKIDLLKILKRSPEFNNAVNSVNDFLKKPRVLIEPNHDMKYQSALNQKLEADPMLKEGFDRATEEAQENYVYEVIKSQEIANIKRQLVELERQSDFFGEVQTGQRDSSLNNYSATLRESNDRKIDLIKKIEGLPEINSTLQSLDKFLKKPRVEKNPNNDRKYERVLNQKLEANQVLKRSFDRATEEAQENYVHEVIKSHEIENIKRQLTKFEEWCSPVYDEPRFSYLCRP